MPGFSNYHSLRVVNLIIMSTTYITGQMWLATAWEEEYQHRVMFANEEDAQAWASRWEDDLLDDVKVELVDIMGDDDLPF